MEKDFYYIQLFEIYGELLTENQRNAFYSHYCLDLSFAEIAESSDTGRQNVYDTVKNAKARLEEYEKTLKLAYKFDKLKSIANNDADSVTASKILSVIGE